MPDVLFFDYAELTRSFCGLTKYRDHGISPYESEIEKAVGGDDKPQPIRPNLTPLPTASSQKTSLGRLPRFNYKVRDFPP